MSGESVVGNRTDKKYATEPRRAEDMTEIHDGKSTKFTLLLQEAHESIQDLEALQKVLPRIYSTLDIGQLFSVVVEEAIKLTNADRGCLIVVRQNQDYTIKIARDANGNQIPPENFQISHTILETVMANKAALFKMDVWGDDDLRSKKSIVDLGLRMVFSAPIMDDDKIIAILYVDSVVADQRSISNRRLRTLETLAMQTAAAWRQMQLYHKTKVLDSAKSDFIAIASHELRTPITLIKGFCEVLLSIAESTANEEVRPIMQGILTGVGRLEEVVNLMLYAGQITQDTLHIHRQPCCIRTLARQVIQRWQEEVVSDRCLNIETIIDIPEQDHLIWNIDPIHTEVLLDHLISNAIKFTPDGGKITLRLSHPEDDWLTIEVADTGIGVGPDQRELVFEKFYRGCTSRLHSTGKIKFMGAGPGLGLYLVRGIIEAHGGYVWVEDNYDPAGQPLGSKFIAQLPRRDVVEGAALIKTQTPLYVPVRLKF